MDHLSDDRSLPNDNSPKEKRYGERRLKRIARKISEKTVSAITEIPKTVVCTLPEMKDVKLEYIKTHKYAHNKKLGEKVKIWKDFTASKPVCILMHKLVSMVGTKALALITVSLYCSLLNLKDFIHEFKGSISSMKHRTISKLKKIKYYVKHTDEPTMNIIYHKLANTICKEYISMKNERVKEQYIRMFLTLLKDVEYNKTIEYNFHEFSKCQQIKSNHDLKIIVNKLITVIFNTCSPQSTKPCHDLGWFENQLNVNSNIITEPLKIAFSCLSDMLINENKSDIIPENNPAFQKAISDKNKRAFRHIINQMDKLKHKYKS